MLKIREGGSDPVRAGAPALPTLAIPALYLAHFGLSRRPFSLLPDPGFLVWQPAHLRAAAALEYAILTRAPVAVVTGATGSGKTTLIHHLLARLGDEVTAGVVSQADGAAETVMGWILHAFGLSQAPDALGQHARFEDFLLDEYAAGRRVVLILDEAERLTPGALEMLRRINNINSGADELVQLILVGQPALRQTLRHPDLAPLADRVAAAAALEAMTAEAVAGYLAARLRIAGGRGDEIAPEAARRIAAVSAGLARAVNRVADLTLTAAAAARASCATASHVEAVTAEGVLLNTFDPACEAAE